MKILRLFSVCAVLLFMTAPDHVEQRFIQFAEELEYFDSSNIFYGRGLYMDPRTEGHVDRYPEFLELTSIADIGMLRGLLKHASPQVRTLALAAIFTKHDHKAALLGAASLFEDEDETYSSVMWLYNSRRTTSNDWRHKLPPAELRQQTVGQVANELYKWYVQHSTRYKDGPDFKDYWSARKDRGVCAGWLAVEYEFIGGGSTVLNPYHTERRGQFLKNLNALGDADRNLALAWIVTQGDCFGRMFISSAELFDAYRRMGHETIIRILNSDPPTTDPDLRFEFLTPSRYLAMMRFILEHADTLLEPEDADLLLALHRDSQKTPSPDGRWTGYKPPRSAEWVTAAVRLRPEKGVEVLKDAVLDFDEGPSLERREQPLLLAAIWQNGGTKELDYVVNWFYEYGDHNCGHSSVFLNQMLADPDAAAATLLLQTIARDERLELVPADILRRLIEVANKVSGRSIVDAAELYSIQHPLGVEHYFMYKYLIRHPRPHPQQTERDTATFRRWLAEHPDANEALETTMEEWRGRLIAWAE